MFSLQIQIRKLTPALNFIQDETILSKTVTARFGPLQTDLQVHADAQMDPTFYCGGKRLLLEMEKQQMLSLLKNYAFGLFMKNNNGRFWSLLSFEKVKLGEPCLCQGLAFYDDERSVCYQFDLEVGLGLYEPRVPATAQICRNQKGANEEAKINSFLYGNVAIENRKENNRKENRAGSNVIGNNKKTAEKSQSQNNLMKKQQKTVERIRYGIATHEQPQLSSENESDDGIYIPPVMEFTNEQPAIILANPLRQPHLPKDSQFTRDPPPKFDTFTSFEQFKKNKEKLMGKSHSNRLAHIPPSLQNQQEQQQRQKIREMAKQQAFTSLSQKKTEIMIPVPNPKTNTYELIPISSLTQGQIIEYAHRQKLAQQYEKEQKREKEKKEKESEMAKKGKKVPESRQVRMSNELKKQNLGAKKEANQSNLHNRHISEEYEEEVESSVQTNEHKYHQKSKFNQSNGSVQEEDHEDDNENEDREDYESDFESLSNAGSILKSRHSLKSSLSLSKKKANDYEVSESMDEYGYSQDFDSFSQSMMSRNKKNNSASEMSGSLMSISYRK